uniref:GST C-terminal domain-containing protein n=1 Tax=Acrobeloides nanus TaxID=290746 RepID=A0A914CIF0_9BILA
MIDGSFFNANYVFKVREHVLEMSEVVVETLPTNFLKYLVAPILYYKTKQRLDAEGTGHHSLEEVMTIMRADLVAVDQILGDKEYIVGNVPSLADCTLFGHLAAGYYLPYDYPLKHMLDEEFPRLKRHMLRMASSFYKDHAIGAKSSGDSATM